MFKEYQRDLGVSVRDGEWDDVSAGLDQMMQGAELLIENEAMLRKELQ